MSSTSPSGPGQSFVFSPPQMREIQNAQFLIGYHMIFLGILSTLSVILILFSTRKQRRNYLLLVQMLSMSIVITLEIMYTVYFYRDISNVINQRSSDDPKVVTLDRMGLALDSLNTWAPLVSDSVLIYRVFDIHSPSVKPSIFQRYRPIIPLVILLMARAGIVGVAIHADWIASLQGWDPETVEELVREWLQYRLAEMSLQILYCSYAFVMIMRQILRLTRGSTMLRRTSSVKTRSRLRFFIEAVLMTFFIPLVFQIGSLISMALWYRKLDSRTLITVWNRFTQLNYIFSAIFAILATSWSTIREGSSTVFTTSQKSKTGSSADQIVGMHDLNSKGSIDDDHKVKVDGSGRGQGYTLLEKLFPSSLVISDEEDVEELRTTQFIATDADQVHYRSNVRSNVKLSARDKSSTNASSTSDMAGKDA